MEKMYLISKDELFDLLVAWHRINCGDCYGIDNWPGWDHGRREYLEEWCRFLMKRIFHLKILQNMNLKVMRRLS